MREGQVQRERERKRYRYAARLREIPVHKLTENSEKNFQGQGQVSIIIVLRGDMII